MVNVHLFAFTGDLIEWLFPKLLLIQTKSHNLMIVSYFKLIHAASCGLKQLCSHDDEEQHG